MSDDLNAYDFFDEAPEPLTRPGLRDESTSPLDVRPLYINGRRVAVSVPYSAEGRLATEIERSQASSLPSTSEISAATAIDTLDRNMVESEEEEYGWDEQGGITDNTRFSPFGSRLSSQNIFPSSYNLNEIQEAIQSDNQYQFIQALNTQRNEPDPPVGAAYQEGLVLDQLPTDTLLAGLGPDTVINQAGEIATTENIPIGEALRIPVFQPEVPERIISDTLATTLEEPSASSLAQIEQLQKKARLNRRKKNKSNVDKYGAKRGLKEIYSSADEDEEYENLEKPENQVSATLIPAVNYVSETLRTVFDVPATLYDGSKDAMKNMLYSSAALPSDVMVGVQSLAAPAEGIANAFSSGGKVIRNAFSDVSDRIPIPTELPTFSMEMPAFPVPSASKFTKAKGKVMPYLKQKFSNTKDIISKIVLPHSKSAEYELAAQAAASPYHSREILIEAPVPVPQPGPKNIDPSKRFGARPKERKQERIVLDRTPRPPPRKQEPDFALVGRYLPKKVVYSGTIGELKKKGKQALADVEYPDLRGPLRYPDYIEDSESFPFPAPSLRRRKNK